MAAWARAEEPSSAGQMDQWIREHELRPEGLDRAIDHLEELASQNRLSVENALRLCRAYFLRAVSSDTEKIGDLLAANRLAAEKKKANPSEPAFRYWWALAELHLARHAPKARALFMARSAIRELEEVIRRGGGAYDRGGPYRLLGRLLYESPPRPFFGDKERSVKLLEKAKEADPDFLLNRLYLGEAYRAVGREKEAVAEFRFVAAARPDRHRLREDKKWIARAQELLAEK